jgi:hypothetical protein
MIRSTSPTPTATRASRSGRPGTATTFRNNFQSVGNGLYWAGSQVASGISWSGEKINQGADIIGAPFYLDRRSLMRNRVALNNATGGWSEHFQVVQPHAQGVAYGELSPTAKQAADASYAGMVDRARQVPGIEGAGYQVDPGAWNATYTPDGKVAHWFDPIMINEQ